jgi:thymidylate kinase
MFTVALIGADGAGKTTISGRLQEALPFPVKSIYMGVNLDTSALMLPTTRLVVAIRRARGTRPNMLGTVDPRKAEERISVARRLKAGLRLLNWVAEEWFRQIVAWSYTRRGNVVIFDRHFFPDYYAHDIADMNVRRPLTNRIHGFLLRRVYPKPDLVICLDAPAEILHARKREEATPEWLERRRLEYLEIKDVLPHVAVVDASRPLDEVVRDVARVICEFRASRGVATTVPSAGPLPVQQPADGEHQA